MYTSYRQQLREEAPTCQPAGELAFEIRDAEHFSSLDYTVEEE